MKKYLILTLAVLMGLTAALCGCRKANDTAEEDDGMELFESICSADKALARARGEGLTITENSRCTQNKQAVEEFYNKAIAGERAELRLVYYYTLDKEHMSEELYEEEKDNYPMLFFVRLEHTGSADDGRAYHVTVRRSNAEKPETNTYYPYLKHYTGKAPVDYAAYDSYDRYVLVNDPDVTWEEIERGMLSSSYHDQVAHYTVFTDLMNDPDAGADIAPEELYGMVCSADAGLKDARRAGAAIVTDRTGENESVMEAFCSSVKAGVPAKAVCAWYSTLEYSTGEESRYEFINAYPTLYFYLLEYDGSGVNVSIRKSDGTETLEPERYNTINHYTVDIEDECVNTYVLVDDEDVTYEELILSGGASYTEMNIRHRVVFADHSAWD